MSDHVIIHGDMREALAAMEPNSIDAIVCDPPYEIAFMGRGWDRSGIAFDPATWAACLRVLKPGGHLVAFGAARTMHRITCAIEDAGFEIRDTLQWVFGSGFPKSMSVAGAMEEKYPDKHRTWHGYGTALKPAHEPITLARKPLDGTVAGNVAKWGTGGIDVDGCRVGFTSEPKGVWGCVQNKDIGYGYGGGSTAGNGRVSAKNDAGRWPPNLLLGDGAAEVIDGMSGGVVRDGMALVDAGRDSIARNRLKPMLRSLPPRNGGASEFFPTFCYTPKASRKEREAGLAEAGIEPMTRADVTGRDEGSAGLSARAGTRQQGEIRNTHPTVKPVAIMQWLVRLVSPPRSLSPVILDPFAGSGSTGVACVREGVRFVGIELEERHVAIARARIAHELEAMPKPEQNAQGSLFP